MVNHAMQQHPDNHEPGRAAVAAKLSLAQQQAQAQALMAAEDWAGAAEHWLAMAQGAAAVAESAQHAAPHDTSAGGQQQAAPQVQPETAAIAWAEYGRCCLQLGRLVAANEALHAALQQQPQLLLARKLLGWVAAEQGDLLLAAREWRAVLAVAVQALTEATRQAAVAAPPVRASSPAPEVASQQAEVLEAIQSLGSILVKLGEFTEVGRLIAQLPETAAGQRAALVLQTDIAEQSPGTVDEQATLRALHQRFPDAVQYSQDPTSQSSARDELAALRPAITSLIASATAAPNSTAPATTTTTPNSAAPATTTATPNSTTPTTTTATPNSTAPTATATANAASATTSTKPNSATRQAPASPEQAARYLMLLRNNITSAAALAELHAGLAAFAARFPNHPAGWRLRVGTAVVANDQAAVAELVETTGLHSLQLWLAAARGEHEQAMALARQLEQPRYVHAANGHGLDLRLLNKLPGEYEQPHYGSASNEPGLNLRPLNRAPSQPGSDRILLFSAFRNERDFAPWFLQYYRQLGVDWFFIVDNLSDDGTTEFLLSQPDVSVFASADRYLDAAFGMRWINELMRRYGRDHWCIFVDADEQLIVPDSAPGGLRGVLAGMAARGEQLLPAVTLDTYPESLQPLAEFQPGDDPLAYSSLIDPDIYLVGKLESCFFRARGGVRYRLFGTQEGLEKTPILRGGTGCYYHASSHTTSYGRLSRQPCVLLHYKLLREALELRKPTTTDPRTAARGVRCLLRHSLYHGADYLNSTEPLPRGPRDFVYQNPTQLQQLGLLNGLATLPGTLS